MPNLEYVINKLAFAISSNHFKLHKEFPAINILLGYMTPVSKKIKAEIGPSKNKSYSNK